MWLRPVLLKQNLLFLFGLVAVVVLVLQLSTQLFSKTSSVRSRSEIGAVKRTLQESVKAKGKLTTKEIDECFHKWNDDLSPLYIITPTYPRAEQVAELTRFGQTLMHVKNAFWIVSEDAPNPTQNVLDYLEGSGLRFVYLRVEMPSKYAKVKNKPRGVANRNAGLQWVRENAKTGVLYFADDDNTYDIRIFEEIRSTNKVSMFPVGLVTGLGVSTPIVKSGKVIGFYDGWIAGRKFPVDMAGFAVNVGFLLDHPNATMPFKVGYEEDGLLQSLGLLPADIEPKADNCSKIWVWHTQTKKNPSAIKGLKDIDVSDTNLEFIRKQLWIRS